MDLGSRIADQKQYTTAISNISNTLRENYNSNNLSKYNTPTQIVDELRKKYDTPTRRDPGQQTRSHIGQRGDYCGVGVGNVGMGDPDMKKSMAVGGEGMGRGGYQMSPVYKKENAVGEEEAILRRIKGMKDSLLSKNEKVKTAKSFYEHRVSQKFDPRPVLANDNRVQNIDKINSKIQQILSCFKQIQNKNPAYDTTEYKNQLKASSKVTVDNSSKSYCMTRSSQYQENKTPYHNNTIKQGKSSQVEVKNTTSIYQEEKKYKIESPAPKNVQNFDLGSNRGENSKVRSFINSIQKQTGTNAANKYEMKSGKKLDDEISKIELKIQQFQDEKRRLNIDFKPYSYSNSKSTVNLTRRSYTIDKFQKPSTKVEAVDNAKKTDDLLAKRNAVGYGRQTEKRLEQKYAGRISFQPPRPKNIEVAVIPVDFSSKIQKIATYDKERQDASSIFKLKLIPVEAPEKSASSSRVQNRMLSQDLRKKTDEGILDRKNRLQHDQSSRARPTIKRLVEKLSEQTNLDEKLRNNKLYFQSNLDTRKWDQLDDALKRNGIRLDREKIKKLFRVTDQQNNPFFSVRESQSDVETLAKNYLQSEQHWSRELSHTFRRQDLQNQQFTAVTLDLQKKGYIVLQDIVRFLNMETGTFYRNRDLFLIFRRISEEQKITFEQLLATFCK